MAASTIPENFRNARRRSPNPQAVRAAVTYAPTSNPATWAADTNAANSVARATLPGWPTRKPHITHTTTAAKARNSGTERSNGVSSARGSGRHAV